MSKGKKFDAAEKHFEKKRIEYEKKIRYLTNMVSEQNKTIVSNKEKISILESENTRLKEWIERLLDYTELSKEDIKVACEKDKKMSESLDMLKILSGYYNL